MLKGMVAAMLLLAPVAAMAQTVTIKRGETVTLAVDDTGPRVVERAATAPTNFEIVGSAEAQRGDYDQAVGPNFQPMGKTGAGALAPKPEAGKIVLRFIRTPGKDQSLLSIQNGYDQALVYRAVMHVGKDAQPTDVCLVAPGKLGIEHWPFAIDTLDLSDLRLVAWKAGDPVPCV
ncbi:MAG: hypothetical protein ACTHJR_11175 [Sphingomonas sp.]|uniref:hypothetical protein n=1 Tax=Sphingomonas sp. TaxID=28214 RepID=UPI003F82041B